jgi:serine/threonine-protein kinase
MMESPRASGRDVVVCIDDDLQVLAALRRVLRSEPYELITTDNSQQTMEWLDRQDVALVIADQRMPGVSGSDILDYARRHSPGTARALITAYPGGDTIRHPAVEVLLPKPWDDDELRDTLRYLLHRHRAPANGPARPVVVFVDDELPVIDAIRRALRTEHYLLLTTRDPKKVMEWVQSHNVAVVIADLRMPGVSGIELLRSVGVAAPATGRVLLTGHGDADVIEQCRRMGLQRFISKPWSDEDLRRTIHEVMRERERAGGFLELV